MSELYPLRLEPYVKEVVWGGDWLAGVLGRSGPPGAPLGESWEAYSGSVVTNGAHSGCTLGELFEQYRSALAGSAAESYPKFPLLVKFIDAKQNLSVQVHPGDELARHLEQYPFGKTEFWYVLAAEPGAEILYGLNSQPVERAELGQAIQEQTLLNYLQRSPVQTGDVVFIPAGTVHALTKGIVVYELQQDSDITYRLYDWGRTGRPIHIEKGLQAVNFNYRNLPVTHPQPQVMDGYSQARLVECAYFVADLLEVQARAEFAATPQSFNLLTVLEGAGSLRCPEQDWEAQDLHKGDTVLVPAGIAFGLDAAGPPLRLISGRLA